MEVEWINPEGNSYVGEWSQGSATGLGVFTERGECKSLLGLICGFCQAREKEHRNL